MLGSSTTTKELEEEMKKSMSAPRPLPSLKELSLTEINNIHTQILKYINTPAAEKNIFTCTLEMYIRTHILEAIKRTMAIVSVHEHKYGHHSSCFKKGKQQGCKYMFCRYDYPREVAPSTGIVKDPAYCSNCNEECETTEDGK
jgi:hypothetical protein